MEISRHGITMLIAFAIALTGVAALLFIIANPHSIDPDVNVLEHLQDGMKDDAVTQFYAYDIEQIHTITNSPIRIGVLDADLNEDGQMEKIVIVQSVLHTGSRGDSFEILKREGNEYKSIFYATFRLCAHDKNFTPYGEVYILEGTHNKFHDIRVITEENELIITYDPQKGEYYF